jgi:hypothetical protein
MKTTKKKLSSWLLVLMLLLLVVVAKPSQAQPCQKVEIATDLVKRTILDKFILESRQTRYFIRDKGIVELTAYTDKEGRDRWYLVPRIDDSYKDNPPKQYATFGNDIILIYQGNTLGDPHQTKGDTAALNQCLEDIIGGRVYIRPKKGIWVDSIGLDGKAKRVQVRTITGGSIGDLEVIFNKDGTYKTYTSL